MLESPTVQRLESDIEALKRYYNQSQAYQQVMQSHDTDYFDSYCELLRRFAKHAGSLLELGCGAGASTVAISDRIPGAQCTGVDISQASIAHAKRSWVRPDVRFLVADAKALPYPDDEFEAVTSFDCLEHIPDPEATLTEWMRVTAPGGVLIVKAPNHLSPVYTLGDLMRGRHRYPFTASWKRNFGRLAFESGHFAKGMMGMGGFVPRRPDLSDSLQVGDDSDAVTDMCTLDVVRHLKRGGWKILNVAWPRKPGRAGRWMAKLLPFFASMGVVAKKPGSLPEFPR